MNKLLMAALCAALACGSAWAADPIRHEEIVLTHAAPLQKISGKIKGRATAEYSIAVPAGARIDIRLTGANRSANFNVTAAGADEALFVGSRDGNRFHATAPTATVYRVSVYLMRNAARRNESASFVLEAGLGAAR